MNLNINGKHLKILKYIISGGTAAFINIFLLYLLIEWIHYPYLRSSVFSFVVSFFVSFILQKFWTFNDNSKDGAKKQLAIYLLVAITNLGVNTLFVYLLVEYIKIWPVWAQIISGASIALYSFFIYKFIFYETPDIDPKS